MFSRQQAIVFLLGVVMCASVLAVADAKLTQLSVGIKHRPDSCVMKARSGDELEIHYTGTLLEDGTKFDSSLDRNSPFEFTLGRGMVIQGWEKGVIGMCPGEKRVLKIPYDMAYGANGSPPKIPPHSDLRFEVELLNIKNRQ
eukprot:Nk52_evm5s262 gene=Nk52_evmTU5s262